MAKPKKKYECRKCGKLYAATDAARKHARINHPDWLRMQEAELLTSTGSRTRAGPDAYCVAVREPSQQILKDDDDDDEVYQIIEAGNAEHAAVDPYSFLCSDSPRLGPADLVRNVSGPPTPTSDAAESKVVVGRSLASPTSIIENKSAEPAHDGCLFQFHEEAPCDTQPAHPPAGHHALGGLMIPAMLSELGARFVLAGTTLPLQLPPLTRIPTSSVRITATVLSATLPHLQATLDLPDDWRAVWWSWVRQILMSFVDALRINGNAVTLRPEWFVARTPLPLAGCSAAQNGMYAIVLARVKYEILVHVGVEQRFHDFESLSADLFDGAGARA